MIISSSMCLVELASDENCLMCSSTSVQKWFLALPYIFLLSGILGDSYLIWQMLQINYHY
jgi:hypothetical protein